MKQRKIKATTRSWEEDHSPRDIGIWSSAGWMRKDLNSPLFGWGQWERKDDIIQQEQEEIFWDQLLLSLLSEMLLWLSRTEFIWRNQRLFSCKERCFSGILCNLRLPKAAKTSAGHWLIWCRVQRKPAPIYSRCWNPGGTRVHISAGSTCWCAGVSISAGDKSFKSMWTSSQLKRKSTFISTFN